MKHWNVGRPCLAGIRYSAWLAILVIFTPLGVAEVRDEASFTPANEQGEYRYLIEFAEPGLLRQSGRTPGQPFDVAGMDGPRAEIIAQQADYRRAIDSELARAVQVTHHYLVTHSGMAAWLTPDEAERIARLPGVAKVERERQYELATHRGPWHIGADSIWDGDAVPGGSGLRGEGMVLGILDTGVDPDHPAFANDPACGHGQGAVPDKLLSSLDCAATDTGGLCDGPNPDDSNGHGTHVAGTAGGNLLDGDAVPVPAFPEISGVAPCAQIRSYRTCPTNSCPGAYIQAGMNSVLLHGDVDVMNFSIGGGQQPWLDNDRRKLDLVDAGVFVAAAAGNTSAAIPTPVGNVGHRGPWVLSVAATSLPDISGRLSVAGPGTPPVNTQQMAANRGTASPLGEPLSAHPIRHFGGQPAEYEGCTPGEDDAPPDLEPFPAGYFDGAVALIQRGTCPFATKITNAYNAGADMVVVRDDQAGTLNMNTIGQPDIPAYSLNIGSGNALMAFVAEHPEDATIDFSLFESAGDRLGDFSLRGPTPAPLENLTKPDIAAPGVLIYAAIPGDYTYLSGTSMASPHAAGAAALVRQAHPDWTVSEVMSAMMMTAFQDGYNEYGSTPWDADDVGSGRIDLTKAALAGLVMDETFANYLAADPATGGDVRTLNTPSVRDMNCTPSCTWTRTVRNTLDQPSHWVASAQGDDMVILVSPTSFSLSGDPGETVELTITAIPVGDQSSNRVFGDVVLTESDDLAPEQHITAVIRGQGPEQPTAGIVPAGFDVTLREGRTTTEPMNVVNLGSGPTSLNWALVDTETGCELPGWLSVTPSGGELGAGEGDELEVTFDAATLAIGDHQASLCIETNDVEAPRVTVPVTLTVIDATAGTLRGNVTSPGYCNADPGPVANATVTVQGQNNAYQVTTNHHGLYTVDISENESPVQISVSASGYLDAEEIDAVIHAEEFTQENIELSLAAPCITAGPERFSFELQPGQSGSDTLTLTNLDEGNVGLVWNVLTDVIAGTSRSHDPELNEMLELPDFELVSAANGGEPVTLAVQAATLTRGEVVGFSFTGTAAGVSDSASWASDTCLIVQAPDGTTFGVGGQDGQALPGCRNHFWNFHGGGSGEDGTYPSTHEQVFDLPVNDLGEWTFTFVNDWNDTDAGTIAWSDVTVTLHKTAVSLCEGVVDIPWLEVTPDSGTTPPGESAQAVVTVDSSGLDIGTHWASVCVVTNDPHRDLVAAPVRLIVTDSAGVIFRDRFE